MKFTELKEDLKNIRRSIYLFEGVDAYFRSSAENQVKTAFLQNAELNFISFDGSRYKGSAIKEITSALSVFPFMSDCRIVKVSEFYPTEDDYEKYLKPVFEDFPQTSTLIIVNSQSKGGCDLKRKKCISYFDCGKSDRETVAKWCYLTMKRAGVSSSVEACEAIADYCLCDMSRVSKEVEKLIDLDKGSLITKSDVDELVYKDADYRIYQMTGAVARRDYDSYVAICRDLLVKGYDQNSVISSLLNYFKNLLTALTSDVPSTELASLLKMSEYVLGKTRQQANQIGEERLVKLINSLYEVSSSLKNGSVTADGALFVATADVLFA